MKRTTEDTKKANRFQIEPGISDFEIQEGAELHENKEKGTHTLKVPMKIVNVIEGPEENEKRGHTLWYNYIKQDGTINKYGIDDMWRLFNLVGLADDIENKFSTYKDLETLLQTDPNLFMDYLSLNIQGKVIKIEHILVENKKKKIMEVFIKDHFVSEMNTGGAGAGAAKQNADDFD